jgi:hypothetical protein
MKKLVFILAMAIIGSVVFGQEWKVVEIVDEFNDPTGDKRLSYWADGTFSDSAAQNSNATFLILVDSPFQVSVSAYKYGSYRERLDNSLFSYKIGNKKIANVPIQGKLILQERDETTSLLYLLKQGGLIQFSIREAYSSYRFDVQADEFSNLLSKTFKDEDFSISLNYEIPDRKGQILEVRMEIFYKWTLERENLLKNNPDLTKLVTNFFKDKDKKDGLYGDRNYDEVMQDWGIPLLEQIKTLCSDKSMTLYSFFVR